MSLGGRWQKGLSHQACMASVSEQGEDQTTQGRQPVTPAYPLPGPGLAIGEACAPFCSPCLCPIPSRGLASFWEGRLLGCPQGSDPEGRPFPGFGSLRLGGAAVFPLEIS